MKVVINEKEYDVSSAAVEGVRGREWEKHFAVVVGGQKSWFMGLLEEQPDGQRYLHGTCQWLLEIALTEMGQGQIGLNVLANTAIAFGAMGMTPRTAIGPTFTLLLRAEDIPPKTLEKMITMWLRVVDPPTVLAAPPQGLKV